MASAPTEKAHTRVAASVMRRILDTSPQLHPDTKEEGLWNFFIYAPSAVSEDG